MDFKKYILLQFFFSLSLFLFAQEYKPSPNYYFEFQEDGNPQFKQVLSWQEVPGSLAYELVVKDDLDIEIYRIRTEMTSQDLDLPPGGYQYSIIVFNLLDKPELQSPWISIEVIKAEIPLIYEMKPENIYIEENKFKITLKGDKLFEDSEYWLINPIKNKKLVRLEDIVILKGAVQIQLPDSILNPGQYSLEVINPGGLSSTAPTEFKIRYLKPFDLGISLGYAPYIPLYDSWTKSNWDSDFYPLGALARIEMMFIKRDSFYMGIEIQGALLSFDGGIEEATIESAYYSTGINWLFKYLISRKLDLVFRLGGGVAYSVLSFDYEGTSGSSITSYDPYLTAGVSMQYFINRFFYVEGGADWRHIFYNTYNMGGIHPYISVGLSY